MTAHLPHLPLYGRAKRLADEVERLAAELREARFLLDQAIDRESMYAGAPCMEQLTTAAVIERMGTPRARHPMAAAEMTATAFGSAVRS
ncbi:hypothetical protein [Nocardia goodfellowii]|uniref:DUF222 domain-containing protein n=1 Tax=Nocardia goodfellowii TaxID=882446 RepID=A0ABS4QSM8_9NOCA|nr:hypothetical protein [Nocardia goodfellowii]MBP2194548.1 hypothetical protein [Nocardia goodfellowii]